MKNELYGMIGVTAVGFLISAATRKWLPILFVIIGWIVFMLVLALEAEKEGGKKLKKKISSEKQSRKEKQKAKAPVDDNLYPETTTINSINRPGAVKTAPPIKTTGAIKSAGTASAKKKRPFDFSDRNHEDPETNIIDRFIFDNDPSLINGVNIDNPFSAVMEADQSRDLFPELPVDYSKSVESSVERIYNPSLNAMQNEYARMRGNEKNERDYLEARFSFTKSILEKSPLGKRDKYTMTVK